MNRLFDWYLAKLEEKEKRLQEELVKPYFKRKRTKFVLIYAPIISLIITIMIFIAMYIYVHYF